MSSRTGLTLAVAALCCAGCGPGRSTGTPAAQGGCRGAVSSISWAKKAVGDVSLNTGEGGVPIETCGLATQPGVANVTLSGMQGAVSITVGFQSPLASGTFDCTSGSHVSFSKMIDAETQFNGVAAAGPIGSCKIVSDTLDAEHWAGSVEGTAVDTSRRTQITFNFAGHIDAAP